MHILQYCGGINAPDPDATLISVQKIVIKAFLIYCDLHSLFKSPVNYGDFVEGVTTCGKGVCSQICSFCSKPWK